MASLINDKFKYIIYGQFGDLSLCPEPTVGRPPGARSSLWMKLSENDSSDTCKKFHPRRPLGSGRRV
jgi:hypothetical protein